MLDPRNVTGMPLAQVGASVPFLSQAISPAARISTSQTKRADAADIRAKRMNNALPKVPPIAARGTLMLEANHGSMGNTLALSSSAAPIAMVLHTTSAAMEVALATSILAQSSG